MTGRVEPKPDAPTGLYIHWPFCRRRCPYCTYPVVGEAESRTESYLEALLDELGRRGPDEPGTLYVGGGTPSSMTVDVLERILGAASNDATTDGLEVTLEANPEDVESDKLAAWERLGVNRLVIGVQSLQQAVLDELGRLHDATRARRALDRASRLEGLETGIDLMVGTPEDSIERLERDLESVEATPGLGAIYLCEYDVEGDGPGNHDRDSSLHEAIRRASSTGLTRTGPASFESRAARSEHTHGYWTGREYVGIGLAASSLRVGPGASGVVRRRNARTLTEYVDRTEASAQRNRIASADYLVDRLGLAMRTDKGLDWEILSRQFDGAVSDEMLERARTFLERLVETGRARASGAGFLPTERGFDVADAIWREAARRLTGGSG